MIIVIGGWTPIGLHLVELLKRNDAVYVEVQGGLQFSLSEPVIYQILGAIQSEIIVVDLMSYYDETIKAHIDDNLGQKPIVRVVRSASENPAAVEIVVPEVFGSNYQELTCLDKKWRNLLLNRSNFGLECNGSTKYAISWDIATYLYDMCRSFADGGKKPTIFDRSIPLYEERYLSKVIDSVFSSHSTTDDLANTIEGMKPELQVDLSHPYVSHVTTVTDEPRILKAYQTALNVVGERISEFPFISVEFICMFLSKKNMTFEELIKVPQSVKPYLKVVTLPYSLVLEINRNTKTRHYPEYFLRNLGIEHAKGTYIFVGSSDVVVPLSFYYAAERRMFSPLSITRSIREPYNPATVTDPVYSSVYWAPTDFGFARLSHGVLSMACGDFQGTHRRLWREVHAYIQSKEVFHVDTMFMIDMTAFCAPVVIRFLPGEGHVEHPKVSQKTPHVKWTNIIYSPWLYNGVVSKLLYKRSISIS